jgi:hypothetical protein
LNDAESTARHPETMLYTNMCVGCLKAIGIKALFRTDLDISESVDPPEVDWFGDTPDDTADDFFNKILGARHD